MFICYQLVCGVCICSVFAVCTGTVLLTVLGWCVYFVAVGSM